MAIIGAKTYRNYIGGEWVDAASGETFESRNPANGDVLGVFPLSTEEDMDRAVDAAREAYERWRLVPAPKRAERVERAVRVEAARPRLPCVDVIVGLADPAEERSRERVGNDNESALVELLRLAGVDGRVHAGDYAPVPARGP